MLTLLIDWWSLDFSRCEAAQHPDGRVTTDMEVIRRWILALSGETPVTILLSDDEEMHTKVWAVQPIVRAIGRKRAAA